VRSILVTVLLLGAASAADAQQARRVGFVIGYPTSAGVLWHISDRVALRPDVTLNWHSSETTTTPINVPPNVTVPAAISTTTSGWTSSLGLSALFYLGPPGDDLRFYLVPRAAYLWSRRETEGTPGLPELGSYESDLDGFDVSGAFGAQYSVHERFRIFGELGLEYQHQESDTGYPLSRSRLENNVFGLRSGVGIVLMF
jgi:hypothetical protein